MTEINAYPLQWPQGWPRTEPGSRKRAQFGQMKQGRYGKGALSIAQATRRVMQEISAYTKRGRVWRIPLDQVVISTNLTVRKSDGLPKSGQRTPEDPGVAVYFELDGKNQVIPCDKYDRIADNLAAVAATLESLRALERHGTGIMERAFTGFEALPSPEQAGGIAWRTVLEVPQSAGLEEARRAYLLLRSRYHPDKPDGSVHQFEQIQNAWALAQQELKK